MPTFDFCSGSRVEHVSPCPSSGGGGAGGGNLDEVSSATIPPARAPESPTLLLVCDSSAVLERFETCASLEAGGAGRFVRGRTGHLSPARKELDEACALALRAEERMRSNRLGSSGDSTMNVVQYRWGLEVQSAEEQKDFGDKQGKKVRRNSALDNKAAG